MHSSMRIGSKNAVRPLLRHVKNIHPSVASFTSTSSHQAEYGAEGTEADYDWSEDPKPLTDAEKKSLIRQMIRTDILSEVAAERLAAGQRCTEKRRPDLAHREEREGELLRLVEGLAPQHRVRPSMLRPLLSAVGLTLGAASSMLPKKASSAISGAMQEVLTEQYNDQLRELREAGLSESSSDFRDAIRELRDEERAPAGSVQAPDLLKMQRPQDLAPEEILAGVVKYGMRGLLSLGSKI